MNMDNVKNALQDLIMRLNDAEKGYMEISDAVKDEKLKRWMSNYAKERRKMRRRLEGFMKRFGGEAKSTTSFLGNMHRIFIGFKVNYFSDDFESIFNEIDRGSKVLLQDYQKCLDELKLPLDLHNELKKQMLNVKSELAILEKMHSEFQAEEIS